MVSACFSWRFLLAILAVFLSGIVSTPVTAQKVDQAKLDTASGRARKAAEILNDISALPLSERIPRQLLEQARAIAVFPDISKVNMLVQKFMKGSGLMARRSGDSWGPPAFYTFAVIDKGWTKVKGDKPAVIVLFMRDGALEGFEKDHITLAGAAGPVGELTPETEKQARGANILIYAFSDGMMRGMDIDDDSTTQSGMSADNHINQAVYGVKGRDIFSGKTPLRPANVLQILEFQNALMVLLKK